MAEQQCIVDIKLCDDSASQETYDDTRYGKIQARDRYWEMVHLAKGNDHILNRPPHIIFLQLTLPKVAEDEENSVSERFNCPCKAKEAVSV